MDLKPQIKLVKYNWFISSGIFVTGFTWLNGEHVAGWAFQKLILQHSGSFSELQQLAVSLNGQFSFVVKKEKELWAACSHTWSFPLFYGQAGTGFMISDDPNVLLKKLPNPEIEPFSTDYFLMFGVTPQNKTLFRQINQIKPGEILIQTGKGIKPVSFFDPVTNSRSQKVTEEKLGNSIFSLFEKYFNFLRNKPVLLPLTSGYDSRLLACLLKGFGHKNVLCATWGRQNNVEVATAQKVAEQLGYPYKFIEYNADLISDFATKNKFPKYADYAGHLSSMPFLQDYFAIEYLKNHQLISEETIAMPGYSGDYFAGSHFDPKMETADNNYLLSKIVHKYSASYPLKPKSLKAIQAYILKNFLNDGDFEPWQNYEKWDFQERQCKFISNANHAWFYFGNEVMMPLFDKEFIEFFKNVPFGQKLGADFYNTTLENKIFMPHQVNFNLKNKALSSGNFTNLKKLILKMLPRFTKELYYPMNDAIYYREITQELRSSSKSYDYKHPIKPNAYNSYIIQWYLHSVRDSKQY